MLGQTYAESGSKPSSEKIESKDTPPYIYRIVKISYDTQKEEYFIEYRKNEFNAPWTRHRDGYRTLEWTKSIIKILEQNQRERNKRVVREEIIE